MDGRILHGIEWGRALWRTALLAAVALAGAACSDEPSAEEGDVLQLASYTAPMQEVDATRAVTVPSGFAPYLSLHPEAVATHPAIGVYLMPNPSPTLRSFRMGDDGKWVSQARVKEQKYYIFGFLPADLATLGTNISALIGDYANGCHLYLYGLPTLTTEDICVVVGVQGAKSETEDVQLQVGNFLYQGQDKGLNYVHLLFDHLYAAYQFSIRVDASYAAVRTIHLKKVVLKTTVRNRVHADVELHSSASTPFANVSYSQVGESADEIALQESETTLTTAYAALGPMVYVAPLQDMRSTLTLECTYDVYDRKGNLIRKDCTSTNGLGNLPILRRGEKKNVQLTVAPTYLYVLSEPELDNPRLKIEN